jgi:Uncharacterised nucleotidyltransferase
MARTLHQQAHCATEWSREIPGDEWETYAEVLDRTAAAGIPVALGGAFAVAVLTGSWRDTKDLDVYVLPRYRDALVDVLTGLGFADYFHTQPYDRWWIYRGIRGETIVDVIWAMANHRAEIDDLWMSGPEVEIRGHLLKVLPAEALLWDKLYIMQRERCDWPDVMNILYWTARDVDWEYLLERMGEDRPLMAAALNVFRWLSPGRAAALPVWVWECLGIGGAPPSAGSPEIVRARTDLLDRRPWYGPDRAQPRKAA